jgi:flagellar protein FlgJ
MIPPVGSVLSPLETKASRAKDAAQQFEALLIGQMLRETRDAADGDDDDSAKTTMLDVADQQFAQLLAKNGGIGLAKLIKF